MATAKKSTPRKAAKRTATAGMTVENALKARGANHAVDRAITGAVAKVAKTTSSGKIDPFDADDIRTKTWSKLSDKSSETITKSLASYAGKIASGYARDWKKKLARQGAVDGTHRPPPKGWSRLPSGHLVNGQVRPGVAPGTYEISRDSDTVDDVELNDDERNAGRALFQAFAMYAPTGAIRLTDRDGADIPGGWRSPERLLVSPWQRETLRKACDAYFGIAPADLSWAIHARELVRAITMEHARPRTLRPGRPEPTPPREDWGEFRRPWLDDAAIRTIVAATTVGRSGGRGGGKRNVAAVVVSVVNAERKRQKLKPLTKKQLLG